MQGHDVIVVGGGLIGAACAYSLASCGFKVVLLEQADIPNPRASSADHAALFRLTFGGDSFYSFLAAKTVPLWRRFEAETHEELLLQTGMLDLAAGEGRYEEACLKTLGGLGLRVERWNSADTCARFRMLRRSAFRWAAFHPDGGLVWSQRAISALTRAALRRRARVESDVRITGLLKDKDGLAGVKDSRGRVWKAQEYVFTAGPWTRELLKGFGLPLSVTLQHNLYLRPPRNQGRYRPGHFPVFSVLRKGFYAFPVHIHGFMKVGLHKPGPPASQLSDKPAVDARFAKKCRGFLEDLVPDLEGFSELEDRVCYTTRTPDGDFILDRLEGAPNAVVAAGLAGRGPMFAPLIAQAVTALLRREKPEINLHRFRVDRLKNSKKPAKA